MARRGFPTFTMPPGDTIEITLHVPSGLPGIRWYGQRLTVRIDRELGVEVSSPVFDRVIVRGGYNLGWITWFELPESESEYELCRTALEMIEAQVLATSKLFRRGYLNPEWLSARARFEVGL